MGGREGGRTEGRTEGRTGGKESDVGMVCLVLMEAFCGR